MGEAATVLSLDVGTSSVKAGLVSAAGDLLGCAQAPLVLQRPAPGEAVQDPGEWLRAAREAIAGLRAELATGELEGARALCLCCQMLGVVAVDDAGQPVHPCLTWADTRSGPEARAMVRGWPSLGGYGLWPTLTWLRIAGGAPNRAGRDPTSKMVWLRERAPELWARTRGLLDAKDYLLLRLTGRRATTYDVASLSWLADTRVFPPRWSPTLLRQVGIPAELLPELVDPSQVLGPLLPEAAGELGLPAQLPVVAGLGDLPAAAVGAGAVRLGEVHLCLGSSGWAAAHLPRRRVKPFHASGTLCSVEGRHLFTAAQEAVGDALEWARRLLGTDEDHATWEARAAAVPPGSEGVLFLPWLAGERAPVDDDLVRGGFVHLDVRHGAGHLRRAVYEGIACNLRWALEVVASVRGGWPPQVRVVGGGARSALWCQILADVLDTRVEQVAEPQHAGVRGAGLVGARALGLLEHLDAASPPVAARFAPDPAGRAVHRELYRAFRAAYRPLRALRRRRTAG